ncbi:hypothetical protein LTR56_024889 [Elasticomyces elasticus]|nr:hypothetical protein LTR56_024889 [Elasticomyces elasticus]KAK3620186.1 hypothetical protein LTR22_025700 [Elasticomyces elasticus]KAK4905558.1 hypothetical protein LTR49_025156 [Elasticomyces elasticus]
MAPNDVVRRDSDALSKRATCSSTGTSGGPLLQLLGRWSNATFTNCNSNVRWSNNKSNFQPNGNNHEWTRNPVIRNYVIEDFNPSSSAIKKGTVTTDGDTYDIYTTQRTNAPRGESTSIFQQSWSVRHNKRSSGTVTLVKNFNAWSGFSMKLGSHDYQIPAVEGYFSAGSADLTVGEGSGNGSRTDGESGSAPTRPAGTTTTAPSTNTC